MFEGRVDSVQRSDGAGMLRYELAVLRVFKGELAATTSIVTASSGATCGRSFVLGKRYLIYAHLTPDGALGDGLCSRTRPISTADEDLAVLGPGTPPRAAAPPDTQNREAPRIEPAPPALDGSAPATRGCDLGGASGGQALALVTLLGVLRRRRGSAPARAGEN